MSLARSASGPGGLTISVGAANSLGASSQQPVAGGLFGASSASPKIASSATNTMAATGGIFGGTQQSAAGGLFGSSSNTTPQQALGGGAPSQPNQQSTGSGLFGSNTTTGSQQQQQGTNNVLGNPQSSQKQTNPASSAGGSAFGSFGGQQQLPQQSTSSLFEQAKQQPQQATSSIFGQPNQQQQSQQQPSQQSSGSLFGQAAAQRQQPQQSSRSIFGQPAQQSQQQQPSLGSGLLGSAPSNTAMGLGGGLFGQTQAKPLGGTFGQSQAQQAPSGAQISAVKINYESMRSRTRFNDLAQPVQDEIALIDAGIQRVIKMRDEIGEFMPQHERDIEQLGRDVKFVESKFKTVQVALNRDIQTVKVLQDMTKQNITDAQCSFRAVDNLRLPAHYHQTGLFAGTPPSAPKNAAGALSAYTSAQDLITYFNRICNNVEAYKKRLDEYRAEIERDMPGVENALFEQVRALRDRNEYAGSAAQDQLSQVLSALQETGNAIVAQAGQIADTRERLSRLQAGIVDNGGYSMRTAV